MKKVTSLLCAMVLAVSAFALPVVKKAPQLTPIQKSVQEGEPDAYYQFTTPTDFVALQYGGGTGDYVLFLYANNQPVAQLSIKTASDNSLAGTYTLGTYGGQSYNSALYQGNNTLTVEYGIVSIKYVGQLPTTTEDIYEIVASQLLVVNGEQIISYSFSGTVVGLAAWKDYYIDCNKNGQNCDKARITLNDGNANSTFAEVSVINPDVDRTHMNEADAYWSIYGAGYDLKTGTVAYSAEVAVWANGSNIEGAYSASDIVKWIGDNEEDIYGAFLSKTTDNGKTWTSIDVKSATVAVSKGQGNTYQYDIYMTDNSNKVYHFSMLENVNTSNPLVYYDSNNDFYAAFALENVTPFTGDAVGQDGMNYFTEVEAYDTYSGNYADMRFFANRVDDVIRIPAGRYSFASNKAANTVEAAYLTVDNQGNITSEGGAWVASNLVVQGGKMVSGDCRYIISGTADVINSNGTLYIEVKGSNSLYRTVNFTIGTLYTGIEEVNMDEVKDGQKMMIDGQLYIKRGENLYNAQGAVVK